MYSMISFERATLDFEEDGKHSIASKWPEICFSPLNSSVLLPVNGRRRINYAKEAIPRQLKYLK